jgi:hypothetical protein
VENVFSLSVMAVPNIALECSELYGLSLYQPFCLGELTVLQCLLQIPSELNCFNIFNSYRPRKMHLKMYLDKDDYN